MTKNLQYSAVIADDEPLARDLLASIVNKTHKLDVIALCKNGREAVDACVNLSPDIIFLDIQMPGVNGFEVVKALQPEAMPLIIFVTALDKFAADAFDLHAVDYILKPIDPERINRAIDRAIVRLDSQDSDEIKTPLIGAIDQISRKITDDISSKQHDKSIKTDDSRRKLFVKDSGVVKVIPFEDIDWVDAAGDYMCVHAAGETHIIRITLGELMEKLDEKLFVRIHRSTIVNIERVISIAALPKGGSLLELTSGTSLKVSRNYRESVRSFFQ